MSLEDDVQALSGVIDDLLHQLPRLVEALDNLAGVVEAEASEREAGLFDHEEPEKTGDRA